MFYDFPVIDEHDICIPDGLSQEESIKYLATKLNEANKTIIRLAKILYDFQAIMEEDMRYDYEKIQNVEECLYKHTHSFHSMLIMKNTKEKNNESDIP